MTERACPTCGGSRLRPETLSVKIAGRSIADVVRFPIKAARQFFDTLTLTEREMAIARRVLKEIRERLGFLSQVGLDYLTLDRPAATLSGGEGQRIRLATQIGSSLVGVLYILDEPSIGLHQRDNGRLLDTLKRLRDLGNTVLVVEHDEETMRAADYVVDLGPGAGELGGHLVAVGTPDEVMANPDSLTGRFLAGVERIDPPADPPEVERQVRDDPQPPRAQPEGDERPDPARHVHRGDRRLRLRQVHPGQRHPVPRARLDAPPRAGPAGRPRPHRGRAAPRQGDRHRPVADRADAAVEPGHLHRGLHAHPHPARAHARRAHARLPAGTLLVQRQGRALRGLPGRRAGEDRDALPARRVRDLRGLPRQALQPRDAGGPLQGQEHRRHPGHDGGGGARVLRAGALDQAEAPDAARRGARLHPAGPGRHHALRAARPSA